MWLKTLPEDNSRGDRPSWNNPSWNDFSAIWKQLDKVVGVDDLAVKETLVNAILENYSQEDFQRMRKNRKSDKIRTFKCLMYNNFYFDSVWKDQSGKWKCNDEYRLTDRAEAELIKVLDAYTLDQGLDKIIDMTTRTIASIIGDDLATLWIVVEKKYVITDMKGTSDGYEVTPYVRINDIPQFMAFLDDIKESDTELDYLLTLVLDGTTVWIETYLSDSNLAKGELDPGIEQFLLDFKKITDRLSQIPYFSPESNLQIKYYSQATHGRYLPEYIKFVQLWFAGALDESVDYDPNHMPAFVSELFYVWADWCGIEEVEWVIENFDDTMDDVVDLLKNTKNPYLLKKMKDELAFSLDALQEKLQSEQDFVPRHKNNISFLVRKYKNLIQSRM